MKKLLVLILLVTMLLPAIGIAEFDFVSMTDEQLLQINKELTAELYSREKTALVPVGRYVVGEDIPEGEYVMIWDSSYQQSPRYAVYENKEKEKQVEIMSYGYIGEKQYSSDRFALKNGNILLIDFAGVFMKKTFSIIEFK